VRVAKTNVTFSGGVNLSPGDYLTFATQPGAFYKVATVASGGTSATLTTSGPTSTNTPCAKVAGAGDHSVAGAPRAAAVARRLGLDEPEVEVVELLVRQHLTLIDLATRRDPEDPLTIAAVTDAVAGRRDVLELLRALLALLGRAVA